MTFKLEDIVDDIYFKIKGVRYDLRPLNLLDEVFITKTFGDRLPELFNENNIDLEALCILVYHQLKNKTPFAAISSKGLDENGIEVEILMGGWKLLAQKVTKSVEKIDMLLAFNELMGFSRPSPDKKKAKKLLK